MELLRPPPGHQDDEAPPPPRNRFIRFLFAALFLVVGMVVFFIGGLVVRNPELPNYLLDQIVRHFQGASGSKVNTKAIRSGAGAKINQTPPPVPTTAEEYVNLMNYDENVLSSDERAIVSILNQAVPSVLVGGPPVYRISQEILPQIQSLKPGDDASSIRTAIQQCRDQVSAEVRHCQDAAVQLEGKLAAAGMASSMAHEVAEAFARRPLTNGTVYWPDESNTACDDVTTLIDMLSKNPGKWKRGSDGSLLFENQALIDQYNAATREMNTALTRAIHGSALQHLAPKTVDDYLNLMKFEVNALPQDQRAVAGVLNQNDDELNHFAEARTQFAQVFSGQVQSGLKKLQAGGDVTDIRSAIEKCRTRADEMIKFYQELPEKMAGNLTAAGVPTSLARQVSETFAQRASAQRHLAWAADANKLCSATTRLVDLLSKNPSKWKRGDSGNFLSNSREMIDQVNAATGDMNAAAKALNRG